MLFGCLVPVDGVWRSGGTLVSLDPKRADELADEALQLAEHVAFAMAAEQGIKNVGRPSRPRRAGEETPPYGVLADLEEPMEREAADIHHKVMGAGLAQLMGTVEATGRARPRLTNTDGDPLELLTARVRVPDPPMLHKLLSADVRFGEGDDEKLAWKGRLMTAAEAANSLAQAKTMAKEQGFGPIEMDPDEPRHWIRGFLRFEGDDLVVEVNSRRRLEAVKEILRSFGVKDDLVVDRRFDPTEDMALPSGWRPIASASSEETDAIWRSHWMDEKVPALGGLTPRRAAKTPAGRLRLERLLRQFEYDADRARLAGQPPMDVDELRRELGMENGPYSEELLASST